MLRTVIALGFLGIIAPTCGDSTQTNWRQQGFYRPRRNFPSQSQNDNSFQRSQSQNDQKHTFRTNAQTSFSQNSEIPYDHQNSQKQNAFGVTNNPQYSIGRSQNPKDSTDISQNRRTGFGASYQASTENYQNKNGFGFKTQSSFRSTYNSDRNVDRSRVGVNSFAIPSQSLETPDNSQNSFKSTFSQSRQSVFGGYNTEKQAGSFNQNNQAYGSFGQNIQNQNNFGSFQNQNKFSNFGSSFGAKSQNYHALDYLPPKPFKGPDYLPPDPKTTTTRRPFITTTTRRQFYTTTSTKRPFFTTRKPFYTTTTTRRPFYTTSTTKRPIFTTTTRRPIYTTQTPKPLPAMAIPVPLPEDDDDEENPDTMRPLPAVSPAMAMIVPPESDDDEDLIIPDFRRTTTKPVTTARPTPTTSSTTITTPTTVPTTVSTTTTTIPTTISTTITIPTTSSTTTVIPTTASTTTAIPSTSSNTITTPTTIPTTSSTTITTPTTSTTTTPDPNRYAEETPPTEATTTTTTETYIGPLYLPPDNTSATMHPVMDKPVPTPEDDDDEQSPDTMHPVGAVLPAMAMLVPPEPDDDDDVIIPDFRRTTQKPVTTARPTPTISSTTTAIPTTLSTTTAIPTTSSTTTAIPTTSSTTTAIPTTSSTTTTIPTTSSTSTTTPDPNRYQSEEETTPTTTTKKTYMGPLYLPPDIKPVPEKPKCDPLDPRTWPTEYEQRTFSVLPCTLSNTLPTPTTSMTTPTISSTTTITPRTTTTSTIKTPYIGLEYLPPTNDTIKLPPAPAAARANPVPPEPECDPLDPSTWPSEIDQRDFGETQCVPITTSSTTTTSTTPSTTTLTTPSTTTVTTPSTTTLTTPSTTTLTTPSTTTLTTPSTTTSTSTTIKPPYIGFKYLPPDETNECIPKRRRRSTDVTLRLGDVKGTPRPVWYAGIYKKISDPYWPICGGSIVREDVVISAAHCFWDDSVGLQSATWFAVAASKIYKPWKDPMDKKAQKSDVIDIKIPARFLGGKTSFQEDIAILKLQTPFKYTRGVRPICVNFDDEFDRQQMRAGHQGTIAGWGLTDADGTPTQRLLWLELPYIEIEKCIRDSDDAFLKYITCDKVCAGENHTGKALCRGDSGGGLAFWSGPAEHATPYLRGVASTAPSKDNAECNVYAYGSFTHVRAHRTFLRDHVPDIETCHFWE